jgi:beta-glucosidase
MKRIALIVCSLALGLTVTAQQQVPQLNRDNIREVVAAMTLEEKAKLVVGAGMRFSGAAVGMTEDKVSGAAGTTFAVPRLGIPSIVVADGPAGLRISPIRNNDSTKTYYCTAFPVATLIASTWDTELAEKIGKAIGNELLEYGVDILLAPALNIHRNPLCGRNFEYFSEDPFVSGKITAALVTGVQSNGVGTSLKHFVANNAETNRMTLNTLVSERALREIYLRGFEIAVKESDPWTVMSSYNLINGTPTSESKDLLTHVLRDDWGFNGFVMTDWFGGKDPVAQMKAGNDLLMPGRPEQAVAILQAVEKGDLDQEVLDLNVERILQVIIRTPSFRGYNFSNQPDLREHAAIARQAGAEGMVLLRNENETLPFVPGSGKLAAFGNTSYEIITGGTGSGDVNEAYSVSLFEGLSNAGFEVDPDLKKVYEKYMADVLAARPPKRNWFTPDEPVPEMILDKATIEAIAERTTMALITIGRPSGEGKDRTIDEFNFNDTELSLIRDVSSVYHGKGKKVVVILNIGGVVETASWRGSPDAILLAWQAGQETGNTVADVLTGKVNPSGKLASTFPLKYEDVPSAATFPGKELKVEEKEEGGRTSFMRSRPAETTYEDDIYVGYRYFDAADVEPAYEFGYGLSYTTFGYGTPVLSSKKFDGSISLQVEITNTGKVAGKEVVQLYVVSPGKSINRPMKELKGFAKTRLLEPGESQVLSLTLDAMSLCAFDPEQSAWIAEKGKYSLILGASSIDTRGEVGFTLSKTLNAGQVTRSLVPDTEFNKLKL